jgi:DinB superfamily
MSTNVAAEVDLRYPVGKFEWTGGSREQRQQAIRHIEELPAKLRAAVAGLTAQQLETPYRPGGWNSRQVVHHMADSHMNSYIRFKLAMTEDTPTIKPYDEKLWAETADTQLPIEVSLGLLEALHRRWVALLRSMSEADFARRLRHPERGEMTLEQNVALYGWHSRHHVAHIMGLRERMGW